MTIRQGISTGNDSVFLLLKLSQRGDKIIVRRAMTGSRPFEVEQKAVRHILRGRDLARNTTRRKSTVCLWLYDRNERPLSLRRIKRCMPLTYKYLCSVRAELREVTRSEYWYRIRSRAVAGNPKAPHLVAPAILGPRPFVLLRDHRQLIHSTVLTITPTIRSVSPLYLLGILNSHVFWSWVCHQSRPMSEGHRLARVATLREFPLVLPCSPEQRVLAQQISAHARRLANRRNDQRDDSSYRGVDALVNKLYGLSEDNAAVSSYGRILVPDV